MRTVATFKLPDGDPVLIEVDEPDDRGVRPIAKEDQILATTLERVRRTAGQIVETLREVKPDECEVQFGVKMSGQLGALIAATSTEANFTVKLKWAAAKKP